MKPLMPAVLALQCLHLPSCINVVLHLRASCKSDSINLYVSSRVPLPADSSKLVDLFKGMPGSVFVASV